jgi:transposase InsO family protein
MMEAKTSKSMAFHKTDGGGEYTSNEFKEFRRVKGITHELTCRDPPQQNARAERMNKTLLEKARCLLFQSGLGMTHWGDAVRTAAYLHNRLCGTRTGKVTPVELAFGHKPDLSHLRVFGCAAYPLKTNSNTHKAATRGRKCVLIGYNEQKRGYLLMDAKNWPEWEIAMKNEIESLQEHGVFEYIDARPRHRYEMWCGRQD